MSDDRETRADDPSERVQSNMETPRRPLSALEKEEARLRLAARRHNHHFEDSTYHSSGDQQAAVGPAAVDRLGTTRTYMLLPASLDWAEEPESTPVWRVELYPLLADMPPIGLDIANDIIIGRAAGPESPVDVDLEPYGGFEMGVSRHHALLRPSPEGLHLIDLKSTNGTMHNNLRLGPGVVRKLSHDDTIAFGGLTCGLRIIGQLTLGQIR